MLRLLAFLVAAQISTPGPETPHLSVEALRDAIARGEAVALDVRGSVPYELGHISGAIWAPLGRLASTAGALPKDKLLVPYCTCKAEELSLEAVKELRKMGFTRLAVLQGGYPAWVKAGLPVTRLQKPEEPPPLPTPAADSDPARGRLAPPQAIRCDPNEVTVYYGRVLSYRRQKGKTTLRVRTDYDTTESVTLTHPGTSDPSRFFLVFGERFQPPDWKRIESSRGVLKKGMRVNAWVCTDGKAVLDWRPGEATSPD